MTVLPCSLSRAVCSALEKPMRRLGLPSLALLLLCVPRLAAAQAVLTLTPQDCVYLQGDDLAWASRNLDDSAWQPYSHWHADLSHPRLWIRCHSNLSVLLSVSQPALQVRLYGPYELYLDGERIGGSGNLATGDFRLNAIRSYPIAAAQIAHAQQLIAMRVFDRSTLYYTGPIGGIIRQPFRLRAGDSSLLQAQRAYEVLSGARTHAITTICYSIIGILSFPLFALFAFDPSRKSVLLLALYVLFLAVLRWNEFAVATFSDYPISIAIWIAIACAQICVFVGYPFYFVLAGRRIPWFMRILLFMTALNCAGLVLDGFALLPAWVAGLYSSVLDPLIFFALIALTLSPYIAFWPIASVAPRMRPIAILCMLWTAADFLWFLLEITAIPVPGIPNLYARWGLMLLNTRGIITAFAVAALFALLFREQRQVSLDRATLAGELEAAGEIQRLLAPAKIDTAPGLQIAVAFRPMREVGGDFYLCRVLPNGHQRILLGDVSGKGAAAAMAATLLLGAAEERHSDSPVELLSHMNRVLCRAHLGGFATCLCVDLAPDGELTLANAGHLSPYRCGNEMETAGGLPLGITPAVEFAASSMDLQMGETLTFVSDGVLEARTRTGELFGFTRTAALSTQAADAIAAAAQAFGQEDDITVLTLMREYVGPPASTQSSVPSLSV
jgi:hypothetical protein